MNMDCLEYTAHRESNVIGASLAIKDLCVRYDGLTVLQQVSFALKQGEILAVVGANGAGKSTLLQSIAGDIPPSQGRISVFGRSHGQWPTRELACQMAVLSQSTTLNFPFTVRDVVAMARLPHQSGSKADSEIISRTIAMMGLSAFSDRLYTQLSGGERQRVQLARVIAQILPQPNRPPTLLILDEPCQALDLKYQQSLAEALRELSRNGVSVLLSSHDLNWAATISDRLLALKEGRMVALDRIDAVIEPSLLKTIYDVDMCVHYDDKHHPRVFVQ